LTEHQNSAQPAVPAKTPEQIYKNRIQKMNDRQLLRESKRLQKAHAGKFPRINEAFAICCSESTTSRVGPALEGSASREKESFLFFGASEKIVTRPSTRS
jgi:S-adenosylmethionine:diacylglycerol 3-amino-3-carboxypropyl transferase